MQNNPYEDDTPLAWIAPQNQFYERESDKIHSNQAQTSLQYQSDQRTVPVQKPQPEPRMPKSQALELVNVYKRRLILASIVVFGLVSGLVAFHQVGAAANQAPVDPSQQAPVTQPAQPSDDGGGFFNQNPQGGNNFGSGGFWQQQPPSSGTGVS